MDGVRYISRGVRSGLPVAMGYIPIAMTFGVLSKTAGVTAGESFLFSSVVYAGASQFMALNMIMLDSGAVQIIIAAFLLNLRHFLMSASLSQRMNISRSRLLPLISFGITDESFSIASAQEGRVEASFFLALHATVYTSWVGGTLLGYSIGEVLPPALSSSMVVGLYAMFVSILIPQMKGAPRICILVTLSGIINTIIKWSGIIPRGWDIVMTITLVSLVGMLTEEREDIKEADGNEI